MNKKLELLQRKLEKEAKLADKDVKHHVRYDDIEEADFSRGRAEAFREAAQMVKDIR